MADATSSPAARGLEPEQRCRGMPDGLAHVEVDAEQVGIGVVEFDDRQSPQHQGAGS